MLYSIKYHLQGEECLRRLISKLKCLRTDENKEAINYIIYLYCTLLTAEDVEVHLDKLYEINKEIRRLKITDTLKYQLLQTVVNNSTIYIYDMPNLYDIVKENCL